MIERLEAMGAEGRDMGEEKVGGGDKGRWSGGTLVPKGEEDVVREDREETKAMQASRARMVGGGWRRGFGGGGMR